MTNNEFMTEEFNAKHYFEPGRHFLLHYMVNPWDVDYHVAVDKDGTGRLIYYISSGYEHFVPFTKGHMVEDIKNLFDSQKNRINPVAYEKLLGCAREADMDNAGTDDLFA